MRRFAVLAAAALGLALAASASAAGPWLGVASGGAGVVNQDIRYVATFAGGETTVEAMRQADGSIVATASLTGRWGVPRVTANGGLGGLSADGRVLVLAQPYAGDAGKLLTTTSFTILRTKPLRVQRTLKLRGDFGFDALSPNGRMLYLIEHVSQQELLQYRVRAYDLVADRLLARAIADKRQADWLMTGWPVARAVSSDGRWVYTLYSSGDNYPFVHALDTTRATAVCIGLPWSWTDQGIGRSRLTLDGNSLVVAGDQGLGSRFALDTRTFKVRRLT